jgi:hypothetical protein
MIAASGWLAAGKPLNDQSAAVIAGLPCRPCRDVTGDCLTICLRLTGQVGKLGEVSAGC